METCIAKSPILNQVWLKCTIKLTLTKLPPVKSAVAEVWTPEFVRVVAPAESSILKWRCPYDFRSTLSRLSSPICCVISELGTAIVYNRTYNTDITVNVLNFQTLFWFWSQKNVGCQSCNSQNACRNSKQGRPWSDCFFRHSLIWVCPVCLGLFAKQLVVKVLEHYHTLQKSRIIAA